MPRHLLNVLLGSVIAFAAWTGCAPEMAGGDPGSTPTGDLGKADGVTTRAKASQSTQQKKAEAANVIWLLQQSKATAIVCTTKDANPQTISITPGMNPDDEIGLVVNNEADYSYGTNQIGEIFARSSLMVNWGEESNYHLVIPNYAWLLFNYDGTAGSKPEAATDINTIGVVFAEQETLAELTCNAQ